MKQKTKDALAYIVADINSSRIVSASKFAIASSALIVLITYSFPVEGWISGFAGRVVAALQYIGAR